MLDLQLDLMVLKVFSNLNDSVIVYKLFHKTFCMFVSRCTHPPNIAQLLAMILIFMSSSVPTCSRYYTAYFAI